ncbi:hypothetical protein [Salinigranum halophilum]|uniref:hypothetical protein n=1 Tax=Salinigranum halophilum TaxID=2565931 RepID=UPI00115CEC71|nr:hypothetical protein [Salinigranum halophilum]
MSDEATDHDGDREYIFIVTYEDETERKRVEYLFNNWEDGKIDRPKGVIRLTAGVDHDKLYEQLLTKVPEEQVTSYKLDRSDPDIEPSRRTVERSISAPEQTVNSFLEYVFSKRKAVIQSREYNEYEMYTKKGRADVRYTLTTSDGDTTARIVIEGYEPAPSFLGDFFEEELDEFSASQQ